MQSCQHVVWWLSCKANTFWRLDSVILQLFPIAIAYFQVELDLSKD